MVNATADDTDEFVGGKNVAGAAQGSVHALERGEVVRHGLVVAFTVVGEVVGEIDVRGARLLLMISSKLLPDLRSSGRIWAEDTSPFLTDRLSKDVFDGPC